MVDFSNSKVLDLAVHIVGNKSKDEDIVLTEKSAAIVDDVAEQYIKEYFFSSFNFELSFQFTHETSVDLNEIYIYSSAIFQSPNLLVEQSINMAKHLYEVSMHPNIKKGELYVAYIKDCVIDGNKTDAVGIFKSETKDFYIDINHISQSFSVSCKKGINTKRLDKGCLIFDFEKKIPQKVYIVDSNRNDALYWKNDFLRVSEIEDAYTNTSNVLKICKKFISKQPDLEKTSKVSFLNKSVQYFETHDNFEVDDFVSHTCEDESNCKAFKSYIEESDCNTKFEKSFQISKQAVTATKKKMRNFIRLDSDIEIKIPSKINAVENVIEQGYDTEKKMRYYKIYYTSEK